MNIALSFVSMSLPLVLVLMPFYLFAKERRWSKSTSKAHARPPGWVRTAEVSVLGIFAAVLVLHIATGGFGMATTPLPMAVVRERTVICGIMVVIAVCWMALGAWRSVSLAAGGMIVSTLVGTMVLISTRALSYERFEDDIRQIPVPVEITLKEQVPDVDVLINGVRMGQAPLHTTMEEIAAKAPEITVSEEEQRKGWKNFGDGTFLPQVKLSLDPASRVSIHTHDHQEKEKKIDLYVRFERKGQPVMVSGSMGYSGPSRMFGQIQPARIPFSVMTEEWDRDVTLLLEKARLADYRVDDEWFAAADTYFHFVRNALLRLLPNEPQFQQVLNDLAASRYQLGQVTDAASAWRAFEAIRTQADEAESYNTDSIAGEAVELLLDKLDADRVIAVAETRLKQIVARGWSGFGWGRQVRNGKTHFSTNPDNDRTTFHPRDYVLAHAVWRLDQQWDAEENAHDNAAESRLVPLLLQSSYGGDQTFRKLANELGGATLDEFNRRQQRFVRSSEPNPTDYTENEYLGGKYVHRVFWQSINTGGPAGARFRRERSAEALEFAQRMLSESHSLSFLPASWMDFLFLEVEGREPLARDFWKTFQSRVAADSFSRDRAMKLQWEYLARIRPLPAASEFVAVFSGQPRSHFDFQNAQSVLELLPVDLRLDVVRACFDVAAKEMAPLNPNSGQYQALLNTEGLLTRFPITIPSEAAVDLVMERLDPAHPKAAEIAGNLKHQGTYGQLTAPMFARLAASSRAEHRLWVVPQIRLRPDATSRAVLDRLLADEDQSVRESAAKVATELEELRRRPLPKLK